MLFLADKYLAADSALDMATAALEALRDANSHKDGVIAMQAREIENLQAIREALNAQFSNANSLYRLDLQNERQKKRKWVKVSVVSWAGILALVALIIL